MANNKFYLMLGRQFCGDTPEEFIVGPCEDEAETAEHCLDEGATVVRDLTGDMHDACLETTTWLETQVAGATGDRALALTELIAILNLRVRDL